MVVKNIDSKMRLVPAFFRSFPCCCQATIPGSRRPTDVIPCTKLIQNFHLQAFMDQNRFVPPSDGELFTVTLDCVMMANRCSVIIFSCRAAKL
jgi:hypothetical protein